LDYYYSPKRSFKHADLFLSKGPLYLKNPLAIEWRYKP